MQLAENLVVAGRFKLNRLIGRGGMGSVWHATHLGLDTACAVKFIEGEFASLPEAQARFEREAKAAAQLKSPHVVTIMDHGVWENTPYIAMELLDGEDLGKRLTSAGALPPSEVNTVIQQVCRALTKAHQAGIVHRDLKPDNIFLVRDDDREIVKVLDFGIAKTNATGLDTGNNTKTGAMLGTPYYMSPEQAQGIKTVDSRSDLWSLAIIVFQALTGKLPFDSEALGDLLVKIIVAPVPVPSQLGRVPPQFDRWWSRAADRDPTKRFQTAKEFADSLAMVLGQSEVTDVVDRSALNAAMARGTALMPGGPGGRIPHMSTPQPGQNPQMMSTPHPLMNTPDPGFGAASSGHMPVQQPRAGGMAGNTTGAPLARTFGTEPTGLPKKSGGLIFAIVGGVLVLGLAGGSIAYVAKGKKAAAGGGPPTATVTVAAPTTPAPVAPPPPAAAPPATAAAPAVSATAALVATVAPTPPSVKPGHATPPAAPPRPQSVATATTTTKPVQPAKPSKADMGF